MIRRLIVYPKSCFRVMRLVLDEIFDESAYARFLARSGKSRSADSYREFLRERELSTAGKPRCC